MPERAAQLISSRIPALDVEDRAGGQSRHRAALSAARRFAPGGWRSSTPALEGVSLHELAEPASGFILMAGPGGLIRRM